MHVMDVEYVTPVAKNGSLAGFTGDYLYSGYSDVYYAYHEPSLPPTSQHLIGIAIKRFGIPTAIVVGLVGNAIAAVILLRVSTRLRKSAVGHLLAAICINNAVFLAASLPAWMAEEFGLQSKADWHNVDGLCQFLTLATTTTSFLSRWYTVSLAVERYFSVWWRRKERILTAGSSHNRLATVCGTLAARATIIAVSVFAACIFVNYSVNYGVDKQTRVCIPTEAAQASMVVFDKIDLFVNFLTPYVIVITLYSITFARLTTAYCARHRVTISTSAVYRSDLETAAASAGLSTEYYLHPAEMRLMKLSVALSAVVIALQAPSQLGRIVHMIANTSELPPTAGDRSFLVLNLFQVLFQASFASPFFVIILVHAGIRRKSKMLIIKLINSCCCNCRPHH